MSAIIADNGWDRHFHRTLPPRLFPALGPYLGAHTPLPLRCSRATPHLLLGLLFLHTTMAASRISCKEGSIMVHDRDSRDLVDRSPDRSG